VVEVVLVNREALLDLEVLADQELLLFLILVLNVDLEVQ
jgi:hypothetical protein